MMGFDLWAFSSLVQWQNVSGEMISNITPDVQTLLQPSNTQMDLSTTTYFDLGSGLTPGMSKVL